MSFDTQAYGPEVAAILNLSQGGQRLLPLTADRCISHEARTRIIEAGASRLFLRSRAPKAAVAGLFLYIGCWDDAHETAQAISTPEGSYWHAIVHRQEPDAGNAAYWFHRVGEHAIFPALSDAALAIGVDVGPRWRPEEFIALCETALQQPGSELEQQARAVQRAEWQLLFDWCARP